VTPITPTSLVAMALLSADERSLSVAETVEVLAPYLDFVTRRNLPTSEKLGLDQPAKVEATLAELESHGVVESFEGQTATVYRVRENQHLAAAYYRNTIIHFFVNRAIAEMALIHLVEEESEGKVLKKLRKETTRLRDILKFEFFFSATEDFHQEIRRELSDHDVDLQQHLDDQDFGAILDRFRPFVAPSILRPFFEAYRVVGDIIEQNAYRTGLDKDTIRAEALLLGKQYVLQGLVDKQESVSKVLFESAISLADNRGLFDDGPTTVRDRQAFAAELRDAVMHLEALAARQSRL